MNDQPREPGPTQPEPQDAPPISELDAMKLDVLVTGYRRTVGSVKELTLYYGASTQTVPDAVAFLAALSERYLEAAESLKRAISRTDAITE